MFAKSKHQVCGGQWGEDFKAPPSTPSRNLIGLGSYAHSLSKAEGPSLWELHVLVQTADPAWAVHMHFHKGLS